MSVDLQIELAALKQRCEIELALLNRRLERYPFFCTDGIGSSPTVQDPTGIPKCEMETAEPGGQCRDCEANGAAMGAEGAAFDGEPVRKDTGPGHFVSELLERQLAGPAVAKLRRARP